MTLKSARRYCLGKRRQTFERNEDITTQWHAKQDAEPGIDLASDFPFRAQLVAAFYSTLQDLDGATAAELKKFAGVSTRDSVAVFAALATGLAGVMFEGDADADFMLEGDVDMMEES